MAEVAELAGVSRTTVSFVLNGTDARVSTATRDRIMQAVEQTGYRPNAGARALAARRSDWIGLVTEIVTAPFAVDIIRGAQEAAWDEQRYLLIAAAEQGYAPTDPRQRQLEQVAVEKLLEQQVEGIIYAASWHRGIVVPEAVREVPTVLVHCFATNADLPCIVPDEDAGGRRATQRLLEAGHERIGMVNLDPHIPAGQGRLAGHREALEGADIAFDDSLVVTGDATAHGGFEGAMTLLSLPDRPTALFCANDRMAMGAYDAIKELGLSIPDDVAVVGFDNQELISNYLRPSLTSVALPFEQMGTLGVKTLGAIAAGKEVEPRQVLDCPLLERSSV